MICEKRPCSTWGRRRILIQSQCWSRRITHLSPSLYLLTITIDFSLKILSPRLQLLTLFFSISAKNPLHAKRRQNSILEAKELWIQLADGWQILFSSSFFSPFYICMNMPRRISHMLIFKSDYFPYKPSLDSFLGLVLIYLLFLNAILFFFFFW